MDPTDGQKSELHPIVEQFFSLGSAENDDRNRKFLERLAVTVYPETIRLTEEHCLGKLDMAAAYVLPLMAEISVLEIDKAFGQPLADLNGQILDWLRGALKKLPDDQQSEIRKRVALNLEAKRQGWLAKAKRARADRVARSPEKTIPHPETVATESEQRKCEGTERRETEAQATDERAARRQAVVMPILGKKGWKPGRLVTKAGVGKNSVYDYLDGTRASITDENRKAIAQALDLKPEELPD